MRKVSVARSAAIRTGDMKVQWQVITVFAGAAALIGWFITTL
ncbi:hypothetical protein [Microvirga arvi]|nr:hypothetical protein [Microvirga arvi]